MTQRMRESKIYVAACSGQSENRATAQPRNGAGSSLVEYQSLSVGGISPVVLSFGIPGPGRILERLRGFLKDFVCSPVLLFVQWIFIFKTQP
jgi:hypothetical protein